MDLQGATSKMRSVMVNVMAYLNAACRPDYEPEKLAEILHYHPVTVAEAMYRLGFLDRRSFERRAKPDTEFAGSNDRRAKDRRGWEPHSWGSYF